MKVEKAVENFDIPLIIGEIILVFAYLLTVAETRGFATVVFGVLSGAFWIGFIVVGILIPIILWLLVKLRESPKLHQPVNFALIYLSFILVLIGGFALRYIVLFGGQL
jgi:formate-dependent nitrite reductase membrane component NrfD